MTTHETHANHPHVHAAGCGHKRVAHDGHDDFLHDGHLHHPHDGHIDEHALGVGPKNPAVCTPSHACASHDAAHKHGPSCGHEAIPHGDHTDYVVQGHLHHPCASHCDDHGAVSLVG